MEKISYHHEVCRKFIHLSSLWMPILIYTLDQIHAIVFFSLSLIGMLFFEWVRHCSSAPFIKNRCGAILRQHEQEKGQLTGATYVVFAALLCSMFFPKEIAVTALSIMLICDTAASLIGRRYGNISFLEKSLEGFLGFICSGFIVIILLTHISPAFPRVQTGFIVVIVAAFAEMISAKIGVDDNLLITVVTGVLLCFL